ncbi:MAG: hypothetical protein ACPG8F_08130 [Flavobacteriaceae bacterium]
MTPLEDLLNQFFASIADREKGAAYIAQHPDRFYELFELACSSKQERTHIVAAWVLEKYTLEQLDELTPLRAQFLKGVAQQKHESKRRPMIKLLYHYCKDKKRRAELTHDERDQIVALCFDYMLEAQKAAALAFSMKTLHFFRKHQPWIEDELHAYIEQRLPNSSAGFRSVVRQIS